MVHAKNPKDEKEKNYIPTYFAAKTKIQKEEMYNRKQGIKKKPSMYDEDELEFVKEE